MRATEFMHYLNIDRKKLKLGRNFKDKYSHLTITMKTKRTRYEHQKQIKESNNEQVK
jgi:hypothetical protein